MAVKLTLDARLSDLIDLNTGRNIEDIDFTIEANPSLKATTLYTVRGKKEKTIYRDRASEEIVVDKSFVEDYDNKILNIVFTWFDRDGNIFATKDKIVDMPDEGQWAARFRKQRERIMDDLKGRAKKYGAGHYVDILYAFFKDEKQDFVETGSGMFAGAVAEIVALDIATVPQEQQELVGTVKAILNNSLDGENKVYETLIYLTTL